MRAVSSKALVLMLALVVTGGAGLLAWRSWPREKHAAVTVFEAFYWKLQKGDLPAARALALPGSEAEQALAAPAPAARDSVARGFALDVKHRADGELAGRRAVRIVGHATVTVDPVGQASAFGVLVPHEVEAQLVQDGDSWRVASFRDELTPPSSAH
jgi:hypothetical protein